MKYIVILRLNPGPEAQKVALEHFVTHGPAANAQWTLCSADTQTYFTLIDGEPDLANAATYAPFADIEMFPVVEADEGWVTAMQTAIGRQS